MMGACPGPVNWFAAQVWCLALVIRGPSTKFDPVAGGAFIEGGESRGKTHGGAWCGLPGPVKWFAALVDVLLWLFVGPVPNLTRRRVGGGLCWPGEGGGVFCLFRVTLLSASIGRCTGLGEWHEQKRKEGFLAVKVTKNVCWGCFC
jgi:hypothetical protein